MGKAAVCLMQFGKRKKGTMSLFTSFLLPGVSREWEGKGEGRLAVKKETFGISHTFICENIAESLNKYFYFSGLCLWEKNCFELGFWWQYSMRNWGGGEAGGKWTALRQNTGNCRSHAIGYIPTLRSRHYKRRKRLILGIFSPPPDLPVATFSLSLLAGKWLPE